jgi:transposase
MRRSARVQAREEEKKQDSPPTLSSLSLSSPSPLSTNNTDIPSPILEHKYDTDTDDDEKENVNPINTLISAAQQSYHHRGPRGKYGPHVDNFTRDYIVRLRVDQEAPTKTIQEALLNIGKRVNLKTIDWICLQQRKTGDYLLHKHRGRRRRFTDEQEQLVIRLQDAHNEWTYAQIRAEFTKQFDCNISDWKISTLLNKNSFSTNSCRRRALRVTPLRPLKSDVNTVSGQSSGIVTI